jgi:L-ascorbate metabolism protein UlaG (beta-lactamase superfamily)
LKLKIFVPGAEKPICIWKMDGISIPRCPCRRASVIFCAGSFLLGTLDRKIYYGGDSGYFIGYREIRRRYPGIDYALLPVTAFEPRWFMHCAHMDAREALDAFRDLAARYFIPTPWGTFRQGDEPIGQAPSALSKAAQSTNTDPARIIIMGRFKKIVENNRHKM